MAMNNKLDSSTWRRMRKQVLTRDRHTCHYCGDTATEADHVIPRSKGGQDTFDNLVAACKKCNTSKGDKASPRFFERLPTPGPPPVALSPVKYYRIESKKAER